MNPARLRGQDVPAESEAIAFLLFMFLQQFDFSCRLRRVLPHDSFQGVVPSEQFADPIAER
jgi:hypothetical protein